MNVATLMEAFGMKEKDLAAEVMTTFPDLVPDEDVAGGWGAVWAARWNRRFG